MKLARAFGGGALYVLCNYVITNIPFWFMRKALYRLLGMKIGKGSRIMMKTLVTIPWRIRIGENTVINEYCYLDGRGGLTIGDRVNVALKSMLITGTHDMKAPGFDYFDEPIAIQDGVWIAARAMVLNGAVVGKNAVIGGGAVVQPRQVCDAGYIYAGVPARKIKKRELQEELDIAHWSVFFR